MLIMSVTHHNDSVYEVSNDNNKLVSRSQFDVSMIESVQKLENESEKNCCWSVLSHCCLFVKDNTFKIATETPCDLSNNELIPINIENTPSIRIRSIENTPSIRIRSIENTSSIRTNIIKHYGMPLQNDMDSNYSSPIDPYHKRINPASGWF
jgi:hypothetical protein